MGQSVVKCIMVVMKDSISRKKITPKHNSASTSLNRFGDKTRQIEFKSKLNFDKNVFCFFALTTYLHDSNPIPKYARMGTL